MKHFSERKFQFTTAKNFILWNTFSKEAALRVINSIVLIA